MERRFETKGPGSYVQGFLNARASVVKDCQQGVITLALDRRPVGLVEDRGDLVVFQMTECGSWRSFRWDSQEFSALTCCQRFTVGDKAEGKTGLRPRSL